MDYTLTSQKKADLLAVMSVGKGFWTFDMAIDRSSIKETLELADDNDTVEFSAREAKTIKSALQSAKLSPSSTEQELDRYCQLCSDFANA